MREHFESLIEICTYLIIICNPRHNYLFQANANEGFFLIYGFDFIANAEHTTSIKVFYIYI